MGSDARELEEVVDQGLHGVASILDAIEEVPRRVVHALGILLVEEAREAEQRDERRAQIVGDVLDVVLELGVLAA